MRKYSPDRTVLISWLCGLLATALGLTVMIGWWLNISRLIQLQPNFVPMQFNTALCIALLGCSVLSNKYVQTLILSKVCSFISLIIAALTLIEYAALVDLGIDQLFVQAYITTESMHPGRMAGNTAACITLLSIIIQLRNSSFNLPKRTFVITGLSATVFGIAASALIGYLSTNLGPIGWNTGTFMAAHTAIGLSLVSVALLLSIWQTVDGFSEFRGTLLATVAPFTIMLGVAIFFQLKEERDNGLRQVVDDNAQILQLAILNSLSSLAASIERNQELWGNLENDREKYWRSHTYSMLADHNAYNSIEWIKPDKSIGWAEPETTANEYVGFNFSSNEKVSNALDMARLRGTLFSNLVYSSIIGQSVLLISPIGSGDEFSGWILARIDMNTLLESFEPLTNKLGIAAQVQQQHGTTLTKAIDIDPFYATTVPIHIPGQEWELVVTPTPWFFSIHSRPLTYLTTTLVFVSGILIIWMIHILLKGVERSQQLTLLHNRLDGAINAMMDGLLIVDQHGKILDINDTAATMLGYVRDELIGESIAKIAPIATNPEFISKIDQRFTDKLNQASTDHGFSTNVRGKKRSGKEIPVEAKISRSVHGQEIFYTVVIRDLTEQLATQEKLAENEAMLRAAIENSPVSMAITDVSGNYVDVNPAFCRWLGYDKDEIIGKSFLEVAPEETRASRLKQFNQLLNDPSEVMQAEKLYLRKDGTTTWGFMAASTVLNSKGDITHVAAQILDIQEEKRLKEALKNQNQELTSINEELDQFAYIASHDLKEPLRTMRTFSNYLIKDVQNDDKDRVNEDIQFINSAAERMTRLIDDLLQLSRAANKALEMENIELTDCLDNALKQLDGLINETGAKISHTVLPRVIGDEIQLTSVLLNLINNSIKFHKPGITPEVSIKQHSSLENGLCTIVVEDNGIGIQADKIDEIFGPFKKLHAATEYAGTGIGLAIVKKVVERHHGSISVESIPDSGTRFTINLQLAETEKMIAHAS